MRPRVRFLEKFNIRLGDFDAEQEEDEKQFGEGEYFLFMQLVRLLDGSLKNPHEIGSVWSQCCTKISLKMLF